ncbi:EAL domain-containing protein [Cytobacillus praedii]|uniref:EAL domain-containing protein n=1 Tax=Cytobacillus praedii TaxID=1742358 RepID=UPI00070EE649|nr:EAL domain-containing protein [Cytobacillus praedii]
MTLMISAQASQSSSISKSFQSIKIKDDTFTQDIFSENDLKDQAIIKSIASLVKELTIEVVFVGVETLEQSSYFLKNNFY